MSFSFRFSLTGYTVCHMVCITHCMTNGNTANADLFENLRMELRRGCLIVAVLAQLRTEQYGYTLRKSLADDGLAIDEGTLYPLLRRLEERGFIRGELDPSTKRGTMLYRITEPGAERLERIKANFKPYLTNLIAALQVLRRDLYGETS